MTRPQPKRGQLIVGSNVAMRDLDRAIDEVARGRHPVLIVGETGSGKEVVAGEIHARGRRAGKSWIEVNCGALPKELADSALFGHVRGAFTGATDDRAGYIRSANGGTLFLDEIGNLSMEVQARLLKVLEDQFVGALGQERESQVDVRFLAATNAVPQRLVREGAWRHDFRARFTRTLEVPPLRERPDDVETLALHFIATDRTDEGHNAKAAGLTAEARELLRSHSWPDNVRELRNAIRDALLRTEPEACEALDARHFKLRAPERPAPLEVGASAEASVMVLADAVLDELAARHLAPQSIPDLAKRYPTASLKVCLALRFRDRFKPAQRDAKAWEYFRYKSYESVRQHSKPDAED